VAARWVRGKSCFPGPPPSMMETTFLGSTLRLRNEGTCKDWNSKHTKYKCNYTNKEKDPRSRRWILEPNSTDHCFFGIVWSENSRCNTMTHPLLGSWTFGQLIRHKGTVVQANFESFSDKATFLTKKVALLWVWEVSIGFHGHTSRSHCSDLNSLLDQMLSYKLSEVCIT